MTRNPRVAAAMVFAALVASQSARALVVEGYTVEDIAERASLVALVNAIAVTPVEVGVAEGFELRGQLVTSVIEEVVAGDPAGRSLRAFEFLSIGRVEKDGQPRYSFEAGAHYIVCLRDSDVFGVPVLVFNSTRNDGPLTSLAIPADLVSEVAGFEGDLGGRSRACCRRISPVTDRARAVIGDLLLREEFLTGIHHDHTRTVALRLFHFYLRTYDVLLASNELETRYPFRRRVRGAVGSDDVMSELPDRHATPFPAPTFDWVVEGVAGLRPSPIRADEISWLRRTCEVQPDPRLWEELQGPIQVYDSHREQSRVLALRILQRLRSELGKDPRVLVSGTRLQFLPVPNDDFHYPRDMESLIALCEKKLKAEAPKGE